MDKSLDRKLALIHADPNCREFILADAKDGDMAYGLGAPGQSPESLGGEARFKTLEDYRENIRAITRQGFVDIMLMSAYNNHALTIEERLFEQSHVTPAVRANDTTDIHLARGSRYSSSPSRPFRSATIDHIQCGHEDCTDQERSLGANLGLYSVTFNNDLDRDQETLERFHEFRIEAERKGFHYFLEVFDPNIPGAVAPDLLPGYINDMITRMLAGVAPAGRPQFLKMVYHGPRAMEELFRFDPKLVIGILGGASGTTLDAFQLLHDAQKYGAKVALFGRKINNAENQLAFVHFLRLIVDGVIGPVDAVKAYHAVLTKLGLRPHRSLEDDLKHQSASMSYGSTSTSIVVPKNETARSSGSQTSANGSIANGSTSAEPANIASSTHACRCHEHHANEPSSNGSVASASAGSILFAPRVTQSASRAFQPSVEAVSAGSERSYPTLPDGRPDFTKMNPSQRLAYHRKRLGLGS